MVHCSNALEFQAYVGAVYMLESHLNLGIEAVGRLGTGNCKRWTKDVVGHGSNASQLAKAARKDDHVLCELPSICILKTRRDGSL